MILALFALVASGPAAASDTPLSGLEGHPRDRFPLGLWTQATGDAELDAAMRRAVDDWNALFRETLGVTAFTAVPREAARVRVNVEPATSAGLMGVTYLHTDDTGAIQVPVSIAGKIRTVFLFVGFFTLLTGLALGGGDAASVLLHVFGGIGFVAILLGLLGHFVAATQYARRMVVTWQRQGVRAAR